jgi:hypothetical protein
MSLLLDNAFEIVLNANDFFGYASADAVTVEMEHFDKLEKMANEYGQDGINAFMAWHENCDPILPHRTPRYEEARTKLGPGRVTDDGLWKNDY